MLQIRAPQAMEIEGSTILASSVPGMEKTMYVICAQGLALDQHCLRWREWGGTYEEAREGYRVVRVRSSQNVLLQTLQSRVGHVSSERKTTRSGDGRARREVGFETVPVEVCSEVKQDGEGENDNI